MKIILRIIAGVLAVFVLGILLGFFPARKAWSEAEAGRAALLEIEGVLQTGQDFSAAGRSLAEAADHFESAYKAAKPLRALQIIPVLGGYVQSERNILESASISTSALRDAASFSIEALKPFSEIGKVELGKLTIEQRTKLLITFEELIPILKNAQDALSEARTLLVNASRQAGRWTALRREAEEAEARLAVVESVLDDAIPILELVPVIGGHPQPQTYLFILQNSDEMRPTGGFIGTVGVLTLEAGHITAFATDDVYNLDRFAPALSRPPAPEPIVRYLEQPKFYLRDANWSPDFSESARQILQFYEEERLHAPAAVQIFAPPAAQLAGVIAIMPEAIRPFLKIVGPVRAGGQIFTADNLTDLLEYQVEIGFVGQGVPRPQRKAIISELGHALIAKVFDLPILQWPKVLDQMREAFDEKHILLYAINPAAREIVQRNGWDGALAQTGGDYLAVFDANMFALKTDPYVERRLSYKVDKSELGLVGNLEINYFYPRPGPFWKTKGYRTWTRVYVPSGTIMVGASGAMEEENDPRPGRVVVEQESGKTVFGAFLAVQAGERKTLRFMYRLPEQLVEKAEKGEYALYVQKQPGTLGHVLTVEADFGKVPRSWSPTGLNVARQNTALKWETSLRKDQAFKVEF